MSNAAGSCKGLLTIWLASALQHLASDLWCLAGWVQQVSNISARGHHQRQAPFACSTALPQAAHLTLQAQVGNSRPFGAYSNRGRRAGRAELDRLCEGRAALVPAAYNASGPAKLFRKPSVPQASAGRRRAPRAGPG